MAGTHTAELQQAKQAFAESVKKAFAAQRLTRDEMAGRLSGLLGSLWNELEADLKTLPLQRRRQNNG